MAALTPFFVLMCAVLLVWRFSGYNGYSVDMSPPSTSQIKCEMRTRLFGESTDAIHRAIKTQRQYLTYLNSGQCSAWRIDQDVESANETQKVARDAYLKHINEHGRGTGT